MEQKSTVLQLGSVLRCVGSIEAGPDQQEHLDDFVERLARGDFFDPVTGDIVVPVRCVDGRSPEENKSLAPNSAGGTESLFVADDLTTKRIVGEGATTLDGYQRIVDVLRNEGHEIGGHTDEHAHDTASGCGANDKLREIYAYIAAYGENLQQVAAAIGVEIPHDTMELIVGNAGSRRDETFSKGSELLDVLKEHAKEEFVDNLQGGHKEVAAVINMREGTSLNRAAVQDEFGDNYQAFNVDAWAFQRAAEAISIIPEEVEQKVAAMVVYNLATAAVLAGDNLRVIVLEAEQIAA